MPAVCGRKTHLPIDSEWLPLQPHALLNFRPRLVSFWWTPPLLEHDEYLELRAVEGKYNGTAFVRCAAMTTRDKRVCVCVSVCSGSRRNLLLRWRPQDEPLIWRAQREPRENKLIKHTIRCDAKTISDDDDDEYITRTELCVCVRAQTCTCANCRNYMASLASLRDHLEANVGAEALGGGDGGGERASEQIKPLKSAQSRRARARVHACMINPLGNGMPRSPTFATHAMQSSKVVVR